MLTTNYSTYLLQITLLISIALTGNAQTKVSTLFGNHMVLQQNSEVSIWGNDLPNTKIEIHASWGEDNTVYSDDDGKWKLQLTTKEAGGPYTLKIHGTEKIQLHDVLLGEVWLCSGQSN